MASDSKLARLRARYREWSQPQTVEPATRRERWKRDAWMLGSVALAGAVVIGSMFAGHALGYPMGAGAVVLALLSLDYHIWRWGVDRFDIVAPWQFREAADGVSRVASDQTTDDTERFELNLWDFAPSRWVTEDLTHTFELTEAEIVGGPGSENIVLEVEPSTQTATERSVGAVSGAVPHLKDALEHADTDRGRQLIREAIQIEDTADQEGSA